LFEVKFSNKAEKAINKSNPKLRKRLKELFEKLMQNPVPAREYDLRKIAGEEDTYRIRLSRYRATYTVYWEQKTIRVTKVKRRKESTYKR
jgi:mRNA interferase RelE/StbE